MSQHRRAALLIVAAALFVSPLPLRAQDVSGTWTIEIPVGVSNVNGVEHVDETVEITLVLHQEGPSVHGTMQFRPRAPDAPVPPARPIHGTLANGLLTLTDTVDAEVSSNNGPPLAKRMVRTMELRVDGDRLVGTQYARSTDGVVSASPRPMEAVRRGTR